MWRHKTRIPRFPSGLPAATLHTMSRAVAVIDIGSNSIKLLVAGRAPDGSLLEICSAVEETRISRGINAAKPVLSEDGMSAGVNAVSRLAQIASAHGPGETVVVATSAVRDAGNGADFRSRVRDATGLEIRILSGDEEAELIGLGLVADPALADVRDFLVFDLGGGSLECLEFRDKRVARAASLRLGCVRLTERCVSDPTAPFGPEDRTRVAREVERGLKDSFPLDPAAGLRAFATGGTMTTARAMLAATVGLSLDQYSPVLPTMELERLLAETARLPLVARRKIAGLPAARADIFPTALATLLEVGRIAGLRELTHSGSNLRFALAARMLEG